MKLIVSKRAYENFDGDSKAKLKPIECECIEDGAPQDDCESCDGGGTLYEYELPPTYAAAIEEKLRSCGVLLGKQGTN